MKHFHHPRAILLALGLSLTLAGRAAAEIQEGDHLLLLGFERPMTTSRIAGLRSYDFDLDGRSDDFPTDPKMDKGAKWPVTVQYFYHWSPELALGLGYQTLTLNGTGDEFKSYYQLSTALATFIGATAKTKIHVQEFIPMLRYSFRTDKSFNLYLLGGIGLNRFTASTSMVYTVHGNSILGAGTVPVYDTSSTGIAATVGGGAQVMLARHFLAGAEARWTYDHIDRKYLGNSSWNRLGAYLWIGTKWNSPL